MSGVSYGSDLLLAGVELSVGTRSYPGHNGDTGRLRYRDISLSCWMVWHCSAGERLS